MLRPISIALGFLAFVASSGASAEERTVLSYCELPEQKVVTNVVSVTVDVDTSSGDQYGIAKSIAQKVGYKASDTLYKLGINSGGAIYCKINDPRISFYLNESQPLEQLQGGPNQSVGWGYRLVTVKGFGEATSVPVSAAATPEVSSSDRKVRSVLFRDPDASGGKSGYSGVSFDVQYQFIPCMGELHLAYSVVEDSAQVAVLPTALRPDTAHYWYRGHVFNVRAFPKRISSVSLRGRVFLDTPDNPIGRMSDEFASKSLGFGCFSGQTQKIANLKDLTIGKADTPTKEEMASFLDRLKVSLETSDVLTNLAAEEEIKRALAQAARENRERSGEASVERAAAELDARRHAAEERAARMAADEAEFQAKQRAYDEGMALHKAAVEQYHKALADNEAQKAANVAQAKAAKDDFARKQADYEAEVAKSRQAQAEYEAKLRKQK